MTAKPVELTPDDWVQDRWIDLDRDPGFHRKEYSPMLLKYHNVLFSAGKPGKVFVPLCGKTMDLIYLADQGHEVIGLEYSKGAIERFCEENSLHFTTEKLAEAPFVLYKTNEKNIKVYQGNMFDMSPEICGKFDAAFDRGSFVAINLDDHKAYSDLMSSVLKPDGKILMESLSYKSATYGGPPHSISKDDLTASFTAFKMSTLETFDIPAKPAMAAEGRKIICDVVLLVRM